MFHIGNKSVHFLHRRRLKTFVVSILLLSTLLRCSAIQTEKFESIRGDWLTSVKEGHTRSEYQFVRIDERAWSAPNKTHNFRILANEDGLCVTSDAQGARCWRLALYLTAFGREGAMAAVGATKPEVKATRVEYQREALKEWYENSETGIRQGFIIEKPPGEKTRSIPLVLDLAVHGNLSALPIDSEGTVTFVTETGTPVLRYTGLTILDAREQRVSTDFKLYQDRLRIRIQDSNAVYPLMLLDGSLSSTNQPTVSK